jgi:pyruvate kinase
MQSRRTRIVATLGPATDRPGVLERLLDLGLDVARLNLSHGDAKDHLSRVARLRELTDRRARPVAVLADLPGPKLRVRLARPMLLSVGQDVTLAADPAGSEFGVTEPECLTDAKPGHRLLLDDGRLVLRVTHAAAGKVVAVVETGGTLQPNKGINLPDTPLSIAAVTDRDRAALNVAAHAQADWLALSFVRGVEAAADLRAAASTAGLEGVPVMAKVERPEAVRRATAIVAAFDGIMVARGDLGVEIPLEQVPGVQKLLIREARAAGKPVVTATDMLDSMRTNARPTRAEASDVANAIFDGTDAVMLSGETAVGDYPVEAVRYMDQIARAAEADTPAGDTSALRPDQSDTPLTIAVCTLAADLAADAIVVPTLSGRTARLIARCRPAAAIIAPVPSADIRRRLAMVWGVNPVPLASELPAGADRLGAAVKAAFDAGAVTAGQRVIALARHPIQAGGRMPTVRVVRVGEGGTSVEP